MANGRNTREIKLIRSEILVALKAVYPAALGAEQIMRTLLVLFPTLEFDAIKRDLHYLGDKGYIERAATEDEGATVLAPWRRRWFRLTSLGMEVSDRCIHDPALEE